jgi:cell division protein FtsI (penicillin-binding protein 3)
MHIASFAGFAPVNSPVIAVAVVLDSPKGEYYATATSAPVFAEVAQQVLEYLGVQHDIDLRPADLASTKNAPVTEDDSPAQGENIQALYDAANDLPSDDPLRASAASPPETDMPSKSAPAQAVNLPESSTPSHNSEPSPGAAAVSRPSAQSPPANAVIVADAGKLTVPSLIGLSIREIIEQTGSAGLQVEIAGDGIAREQAPAPGTAVSRGTRIVVRCSR